MALVAVGILATAVLGGYTVTRMLRDPEEARYPDPHEKRISMWAFVYPIVPVVVLIAGHWQGAILLALFVPVMFWLARMNRDYQRERQRRRRR